MKEAVLYFHCISSRGWYYWQEGGQNRPRDKTENEIGELLLPPPSCHQQPPQKVMQSLSGNVNKNKRNNHAVNSSGETLIEPLLKFPIIYNFSASIKKKSPVSHKTTSASMVLSSSTGGEAFFPVELITDQARQNCWLCGYYGKYAFIFLNCFRSCYSAWTDETSQWN